MFSIVLAMIVPNRAQAQASRETHLDVQAQSNFPIDVGARVALEVPYRVRLSVAAGVMPRPYADTINALIVALGGYPSSVGQLVAASFAGAFSGRIHVGWRPLVRYGFYVDVGYGLVGLGGGVGLAQLNEAAGRPPPNQDRDVYASLRVVSTLHMIDVELGYEQVFGRYFFVRGALGFAGTVAARTSITQPNGTVPARLQPYLDEAASYLDTQYRAWAMSPVATLALGVRCF